MLAVAYSSAPLAMPEGRGAVVVFRDVTSRIEDEAAAQRAAVERLVLTTTGESATAAIEAARADLVDALTIRELTLTTGDGWVVDATMAPPDA